MAVEAKLATFKKASDSVAMQSGLFHRIVASSFDLEAMGIGQASTNIMQLGKAFEDPAKGATALKKAGTLTAKDLEIVKRIQEVKGLTAAQSFLIEKLEAQAKGQAALKADPIKKMNVAWGEVSETVGKKLAPHLEQLGGRLAVVFDKMAMWIDRNPTFVKGVAIAGVALLALGFTAKLLSPAISLLTGVWGIAGKAVVLFGGKVSFANKLLMSTGIMLLITAIAVGAYLIITNWDKVSAFFIYLWVTVKGSFLAAWEWIKNMFLSYTPIGLVIRHWDKIKAFFATIWDNVKGNFLAAWEWIKNMLLTYNPVRLIFIIWDKVSAWFTDMWSRIKDIFLSHVDWVMGLGSRFVEAGKNIAISIWEGIKSMAHKPIEAITGITDKIMRFWPQSPAKEGALKNINRIRIVETISENIKAAPAIAAMRRVTNAIAYTETFKGNALRMQTFQYILPGGGGFLQQNQSRRKESSINPVQQRELVIGPVHFHFNNVGGDIVKQIDSKKREIVQVLKEAVRQVDRTRF
jgi:hypothetical protein